MSEGADPRDASAAVDEKAVEMLQGVAAGILDRALGQIARVSEGERLREAKKQAVRLGPYVQEGFLSRDDALHKLTSLSGLVEAEPSVLQDAIKEGLNEGAARSLGRDALMEGARKAIASEAATSADQEPDATEDDKCEGEPGADDVDDADGSAQRESQADKLVKSAAEAELFHTPGGYDSEGYASIEVKGHRETWPVNARGFRRWLGKKMYDEMGKVPGGQAMQDALNVIAGLAIHDGPEMPVAVRIAGHEGNLYLDLADDEWRVVEITKSGWEIIEGKRCPVRFVRKRGMLALPAPQRGGSVDELRPLINVQDEDSWTLLVSFLVAALFSVGPYPVLIVLGEHGTAKSMLCRLLRLLIDANKAPLRRPPRHERDVMIAASNGWLVVFENISSLRPDISDMLCCLSTGGGYGTRELYTDGDEKLFDAMRPAMLNGIGNFATRPDLLDRAIILNLKPIPDENRREEAELLPAFEKVRSRVLGALLDAVSAVIRNRDSVTLDAKPRMADFAVVGMAAEEALGWEPGRFMAAYVQSRDLADYQALEASVIGAPVQDLVAHLGSWEGTATALLEKLEGGYADDKVRGQKWWPQDGRGMGAALRRIAPNLRAIGIAVELDLRDSTKNRNRLIRLERLCNSPSEASTPSEDGPGGLPEGDLFGRSSDGADGGDLLDRPTETPPDNIEKADADGVDDADGVLHTESACEEEVVEWEA